MLENGLFSHQTKQTEGFVSERAYRDTEQIKLENTFRDYYFLYKTGKTAVK